MGLYPCSNCRKFFKGPAQAAYPALVMGNESEREHLRLCPPCFEEFLDTCQTQLFEAVVGETAGLAESHCLDCGDAPGRTALFVTLYPNKDEPRQFYGRLADGCVAPARAAWLARVPRASRKADSVGAWEARRGPGFSDVDVNAAEGSAWSAAY